MSRARHWQFSSEAVAPGHPDKACDQISDLIVDFFLDRDPDARVAAETMVSDRFLAICGEFRTEPVVIEEAKIVLPYRIRDMLTKLYPSPSWGFDWAGAKKTFELKQQSPDIAQGIDLSKGLGSGDQGVVFGYACDETDELMPLPIVLANKMMQRHWQLFDSNGKAMDIGSDAKCQVTVRYDGSVPKSVDKVVISTQHAPGVDVGMLREFVISEIVEHVIPPHLRSPQIVYMVNPTGRFVIGGPQADTGLTGRKCIADTYGGSAPHGGASFSGKDPTKIDRSGSYMARAMAKGIVSSGLASRCVVQLAYSIGRADPVSMMIDFMGTATGIVAESTVEKILSTKLDLTPVGMMILMNLRRPIYEKTATFGHFGRELSDFCWETTAASYVRDILERALGEKI